MSKFADRTKVTVAKSKAEIEEMLDRFGADGFVSGREGSKVRLAFMAHAVMPDGRTLSDHVSQNIAIAYDTGIMPPLLPGRAVSAL